MPETNVSISQRENYEPSQFSEFLWWLSTAEKELLAQQKLEKEKTEKQRLDKAEAERLRQVCLEKEAADKKAKEELLVTKRLLRSSQ